MKEGTASPQIEYVEARDKELVMKPRGDLILPTERRRLAFYLLRSHLVGHRHTP